MKYIENMVDYVLEAMPAWLLAILTFGLSVGTILYAYLSEIPIVG